MGNCISEDAHKGHKDFLKSVKTDPEKQVTSFRVYLHRRNKFIHAWLRISADDVILERSKADIVVWPLQFLRRYGYTSAGVFFFESGRRCPTGEGLHTFQSQNADAIFQLIQSRIQDNINTNNVETLRRNERARSTGPIMGTGVSFRCINPIQRYGSEGAGVGLEYLSHPSGYNSYHRGSAQRLRNIVIPPPPRPRSVGEGGVPSLPPDSFHPHRHNTFVDQRLVGSIISESTNPSAVDEVSQRRSSGSSLKISGGVFSVPYVNISPQEVFNDEQRSRGVSSSSSQSSMPNTPTRTVFPLRWDTGAGSTNVLCYTKPASPTAPFSPHNPIVNDSILPSGRYVNVAETGGRTLVDRDESNSPRPLNYAEVGLGTEPERVPSRCSSVGQRADTENGAVSYTLIDAEKTRALQVANGERRRNPTGH